jgi:hypothetical protein
VGKRSRDNRCGNLGLRRIATFKEALQEPRTWGRVSKGKGGHETRVFGPKAQTPVIPSAKSDHLPLNAKSRGMVKAEKGGLFTWLRACQGRVSTQLILSHLWGTDMSYIGLKKTKEQGTGDQGMHS